MANLELKLPLKPTNDLKQINCYIDGTKTFHFDTDKSAMQMGHEPHSSTNQIRGA
jgi:hypothetical protein